MRKPSSRQDQIDALLPSMRRLLVGCPQFTITPTTGPMRGIEYSQGRLAIAYLARAVRVDGRLRASGPHSLDVRYDADIVLGIRWKDGCRRIVVYKSGQWESRLEFLARK